ncbi:MAG: hypothetical protein HYR76_09595 [Ignavibacteria bacterium]|nr:hypothetical protein [Ignavibacteria bacterium]
MNRSIYHVKLLIALGCALLFHRDGTAQTPFSQRFDRTSLCLEALIPKFKRSGYSGGAFFLTGRFRTSPENMVVIEIPYAVASYEDSYYMYLNGSLVPIAQTTSDNTIGNPYIGTEIGKPESIVFGEIGARFPLASDKSYYTEAVAIASDIDRWEAFLAHAFTVGGAINVRVRDPQGPFLRVRFGPSLWLPTRGGGGIVALSPAISAGFDGTKVTIALGLSFRELLDLSSSYNTNVSQFLASTALHLGIVHPQLQLRLPLDDNFKRSIDYVLGMGVAVELK